MLLRRHPRAVGRLLASAALGLAALLGGTALAPAGRGQEQSTAATGVRALDGGTIVARLDGDAEVAIHLLGVQPPPADSPLAPAATALVASLVADQALLLEPCGPDTDGPLPRHVRVMNADGGAGAWVNHELLAAGLARLDPADLGASGCHADELQAAQAAAMAAGLGVWATLATPVPSPGPSPQVPRSHDWRVAGYPAVVAGQLYDPDCLPFRAVGSNLANLPFRGGVDAELQWMDQHAMRWMRVFATGHTPGPAAAPADAAAAVAALRALLDRVQAFNGARDPAERIFVLVSLTDYYPPGVPGDRYAYDHPRFSSSPVLPAPWYRAGVPSFAFDQEHDFGRLSGLPNYEQHYKPWVQRVVAALADSQALLGWQLGNELKARGSPRNGIDGDQAYGWYLAFTQDMVDTIRAHDRRHLVFTGTQYVAELVDWEYRPQGDPIADLAVGYRQRHQRLLAACGQYCWNVLGLTAYDFNLYPLDDALLDQRAGVASVMTEFGFTRGTAELMQQRYGGDRATAVRAGLARPWRTVDGGLETRLPGVAELVQRGLVSGVAPWGSPAPAATAGPDMDVVRGITGAPDAGDVWAAWGDAGARLRQDDRDSGPSPACRAFLSSG